MQRIAPSRRYLVDLLRRPPVVDRSDATGSSADLRSVDRVREMLDLVDRGLLSEEELEDLQDRLFDS